MFLLFLKIESRLAKFEMLLIVSQPSLVVYDPDLLVELNTIVPPQRAHTPVRESCDIDRANVFECVPSLRL